MNIRAVQMPLTFIIFLIILIVIFAIFLIWNSTGIGAFKNLTGTVSCGIVNNTSRGNVMSGCFLGG